MKLQGTYRSVERGEEPTTVCDAGSELRLHCRREREKKGEDNKWDGKIK